jgi:homoserine kinase
LKATAFAPGSIGNVGPGFDVLGLAVEGIGDTVTVELTDGEARVAAVTGRDAAYIPRDANDNVAVVAARAWLREAGIDQRPIVTIHKGLAYAGGMGGSAASSVGGAYAAALAAGVDDPDRDAIVRAALEGEASVAGRHLDNIAPSVFGGLALCRSVDPIDIIAIKAPDRWGIVLVTQHVRIETKTAREILPKQWARAAWVQQMANTAALAHAFATADAALLRRALDDRYAEPLRAPLIPNFHAIKEAALANGALGCSISGSGPTIFAITETIDPGCAEAMRAAAGTCDVHIARIAREGVRAA